VIREDLHLLKLCTVDAIRHGIIHMKRLAEDPIELRQEVLTLIEQYEIALELLSKGEVRQKMLQEIAEMRARRGKLPSPPLTH